MIVPKPKHVTVFILAFFACMPSSTYAISPEFVVEKGSVRLVGVGPNNPIVYDNDWWFDVFDNNYLWAQASLGQADLRGNIVSRDMWDWQKGYHYEMEQCVRDAQEALDLARLAGLKSIPDLTIGADRVLMRPESGRIEDTRFTPSDGSRLIVREALRATPAKPLLVVSGGPLTTVANAILAKPEIAPNLVVFNLTVSSNGYNGKDSWSAYVVAKRTRLVDWATGSFWDKNSVFTKSDFDVLPKNPFCEDMRRLIRSNLGQANQLGDGAPLVWLWQNRCWSGARRRAAVWRINVVVFEETDSLEEGDVLEIPKQSTRLDECSAEFFRVLTHRGLFPSIAPK